MQIEVPAGEVVDRITILEIKAERLPAEAASAARDRCSELIARWEEDHGALGALVQLEDLRAVNRSLWEVEDALRACEAEQVFGLSFVELARSVYRLNDRRAALKRAIDELVGSRLREHKSYGINR